MSPGLINLFKGVIGGLINGGAYIRGSLITGVEKAYQFRFLGNCHLPVP